MNYFLPLFVAVFKYYVLQLNVSFYLCQFSRDADTGEPTQIEMNTSVPTGAEGEVFIAPHFQGLIIFFSLLQG